MKLAEIICFRRIYLEELIRKRYAIPEALEPCRVCSGRLREAYAKRCELYDDRERLGFRMTRRTKSL